VLQFSDVIFYDIGSVWNQRVDNAFFNSRFYSSVGLGIRGHFTKSDNPDHIMRLDIPYNFHTNKFALSLGFRQYFSATSNHKFKLPQIYSSGYDYE
jgi:hemolysin activation/secretion protein